MKTQRIFVLIILSLVMLFVSIGCQTISQEQRTKESKLEQTKNHYAAPDGAKGIARCYAKRYKGKRTTSGEIYNPKKLTAAHPTLPLGTRAMVVNLANNKSVIVTINDRCREHEDSFIDLSRQAARQLGMVRQGKANVRIILVEKDNPSDEILTSTQK
jgi:rare lipoprotein A